MRASPRRVALLAAALLLAVSACSSPGDSPGGEVKDTPTLAPTANPTLRDRAAALAAKLSDTDLVGQVLMPSVGLSDSAEKSAKLIADYHLGGVILMGDVEHRPAARPTRCAALPRR